MPSIAATGEGGPNRGRVSNNHYAEEDTRQATFVPSMPAQGACTCGSIQAHVELAAGFPAKGEGAGLGNLHDSR